MATLDSVITYARQLAQTDSNGISDTLGIAFANDALENMTRALLERDIDAAQTQESYTTLTTSNPNTYAWPTNMFALKTIEVNMVGGDGQNFLQVTAMDVANIQNTSFDWLRLNQPTQQPLFDNRGDTFEIFPIPPVAITGGLRIFYFLQPTEYTAGSDTISYPQSLDYRCLSARVAALYFLSLGDSGMNGMNIANAEYERRLQGIIRILAPSSQQPIAPSPLQISGWQY